MLTIKQIEELERSIAENHGITEINQNIPFGELLKLKRESLGLRLGQLSNKINLPKQSISAYERGVIKNKKRTFIFPDYHNLIILTEFLKISPKDLRQSIQRHGHKEINPPYNAMRTIAGITMRKLAEITSLPLYTIMQLEKHSLKNKEKQEKIEQILFKKYIQSISNLKY